MSSDRTYWFPAKRYGWGWGPPAVWQGWAVLVAYIVLGVGGALLFPPATQRAGYLATTAVLTAMLMAICWLKGEPPRWRWGNHKVDN